MARPKKDESIKRTKNVMVRFTDVEYALVSCSAEQAGYPVAVYVRQSYRSPSVGIFSGFGSFKYFW